MNNNIQKLWFRVLRAYGSLFRTSFAHQMRHMPEFWVHIRLHINPLCQSFNLSWNRKIRRYDGPGFCFMSPPTDDILNPCKHPGTTWCLSHGEQQCFTTRMVPLYRSDWVTPQPLNLIRGRTPRFFYLTLPKHIWGFQNFPKFLRIWLLALPLLCIIITLSGCSESSD
jgi:hypothetical protein